MFMTLSCLSRESLTKVGLKRTVASPCSFATALSFPSSSSTSSLPNVTRRCTFGRTTTGSTGLKSKRHSTPENHQRQLRIAVIGGGASGIFAAIHAASPAKSAGLSTASVTVFEAGSQTLTKVKISGGGRCNVLHDATKSATELLAGYPRGAKELRGLLSRHYPVTAAATWFMDHGVPLKTEADGRMFPTTDSSQTVMDALLTAASDANVRILLRSRVDRIVPQPDCQLWQVMYTSSPSNSSPATDQSSNTKQSFTEPFDAVILATGSAPVGYALVHDVVQQAFVETVPSLFTLNCRHAVKEGQLLYGLSGVSVSKGRVSFLLPQSPPIQEMKTSINDDNSNKRAKKPIWITQEGPLLITHHGLSGPAALRLSAFGARDFATAKYRGELRVHWAPDLGTTNDVFDQLWAMTQSNPKKTVASQCPLFIAGNISSDRQDSMIKDRNARTSMTAVPKRLWAALAKAAGMEESLVWGQASKKGVRTLAELITACPLELTGKGTFKEEFVTAGGVALSGIDMKTMESKTVPGLFFCGEVINVDGVTGGYNFLNCWATGFVAGSSAAAYGCDEGRERIIDL